MTWILVITALVNGQVVQADRTTYKTEAECRRVLDVVKAHPLFKQFGAKASCEKL